MSVVFEDIFSAKSLTETFLEEFGRGKARGLDGTSVEKFRGNLLDNIDAVSKKCISSEFHFTPYLQKLISKGAKKKPRVISIPTVRDQLVLAMLKRSLQEEFSESVVRKLPNNYICEIKEYLEESEITNCYYKSDILNFYGTINRKLLFNYLGLKFKDERFLDLIKKSIENVTVPSGARKKDYDKHLDSDGVPQGLSISNILAEIYLGEVDKKVKSATKAYFRYVDDIIVFNSGEEKECLKNKMVEIFSSSYLDLNVSKTSWSYCQIWCLRKIPSSDVPVDFALS